MRVKYGPSARRRRKKVLKKAKGFFGSKHRLFRTAKNQLLHSGQDSYAGRKKLKSDFRSLWISRINAACRQNNITYKEFMHLLKVTNIKLNRKMLSEIAVRDDNLFSNLVKQVKDKYEAIQKKDNKDKEDKKK